MSESADLEARLSRREERVGDPAATHVVRPGSRRRTIRIHCQTLAQKR